MADQGRTKRKASQRRDANSARKIIPTAVASIGDDRNWNVSDAALDELAAECGVELDARGRDLIRWLLMSHLSIANQLASAPKEDEIVRFLDKLDRHAHSLRDALAHLKSGAKPITQVAWSVLTEVGFSDTSSRSLQTELTSLLKLIPSARELLADRQSIQIATGRQPRLHLQDLIWQLSFIFERAGGKASANYSPNARMPSKKTGGRKSPFIKFVFGLMGNLPLSMHEDFAALAEIIHRALADRPPGWTHPNLKMEGQNSRRRT